MNIFNKEAKFWKWFLKHLNELSDLDADNPIVGELHQQLMKIHPLLVFEVTPKDEKGQNILVISTDGVRGGIPAVKKLVSSAPEIIGWQIIAFRPALTESITIEMEGVKISSDDILFDYRDRPDERIDVTLYTKDVNENNRDEYMRAAFVLLDAAIGEYAVMTKIGEIDLQPTTATTQSLQPLTGLASIVH